MWQTQVPLFGATTRGGAGTPLAWGTSVPTRRVMQLVLSLQPGGTERLVIEICKRLADRVEFTVCCLDAPGAWAAELEPAGIPVVSLGRRPGFHPSLAVEVARLARDRGIDVVHCHHYSPYVYGLLASLVAPVQLVFTEHGRLSSGAPSRKRRLVNPLLARLGGRVCAVSADLRRHMLAEGFPAGRVEVIYNGIEPGPRPDATRRAAARRALGVAEDACVIGAVGRLDPVKHLTLMLQAHALVTARHPHAHAVIVGDGPERARLEAEAARLGISGAVTFAGYRADVRDVMPAFDVYLNCSAYEGVSLTILEAMAARVPVVATPVGGNPEVVIDGETGCLVPASPVALAEAVVGLLLDPARRRVMGQAGRWRVRTHFSLARMVEAYAAAYRAPATSATTSDAPMAVPAPAEAMSVSDATRSVV